MSHVNTFRSHLMQQFVAQSSRQMRPPLALTSVVGPRHGGKGCSSSSHSGYVSTTGTIGEPSTKFQQQKQVNRTESNGKADECDGGVQNHLPEEAQLVQSIIISRRTVSNYAPKSSWESYPQKIVTIRQAIFRAITCAIQAPNHRRTEPWTFKTLIYPSTKRQALLNLIHDDKRQRWDNVPAFIVALVHGQPNQVEGLSLNLPKLGHDELQNAVSPTNYSTINSGISVQHELPLIPPSTMQQMEDYAATCAAVQNLMLSLWSEGLPSKWSTGGITRTASFRELIQANPDELVVGLIMTGFPIIKGFENNPVNPGSSVGGRKVKRSVVGNILHEL